MKKFIRSMFPKEFWRDRAHFRALMLAAVYAFMLVMQLFTYEDFSDVVRSYMLPGGEVATSIVAALIPLLGYLALPYLLSMHVTPILWRVFRVATVALPGVWVVIALWTNMRNLPSEAGIFGATLPTISSWWFVMFTGLMMFAAVLVVCELKPHPQAKSN